MQNFFCDALSPYHKYRQNALLDATFALINGASLTLTITGRYLPGAAQVKNKIKRVDRLPGNTLLHCNTPLIFNVIVNMLTQKLTMCVTAVDWSGYSTTDSPQSVASHFNITKLLKYLHINPIAVRHLRFVILRIKEALKEMGDGKP